MSDLYIVLSASRRFNSRGKAVLENHQAWGPLDKNTAVAAMREFRAGNDDLYLKLVPLDTLEGADA